MMDLKSMLNDASNQRQPPRLHTPQSSYDHGIAIANANANANPIAIDAQPERPSSYPPPHPSSDQRQSANGSYFNLQSPHQQQSAIAASASTPTIASQPSFAQSPGPHGPVHTPRDNNPRLITIILLCSLTFQFGALPSHPRLRSVSANTLFCLYISPPRRPLCFQSTVTQR